jgi:hypothetical protein
MNSFLKYLIFFITVYQAHSEIWVKISYRRDNIQAYENQQGAVMEKSCLSYRVNPNLGGWEHICMTPKI